MSKNGAYKILLAQKDNGCNTPKSIDTFKNKLSGGFIILKSTHFDKGQQYGYLACIIPEEKYRIVVTDTAWECAAPVNPRAYAAAALAAGVSVAH